MKKEIEKLFEEKQFDNAQYAQDELQECLRKKAKCKKGLIFAIVGTACSLVGYMMEKYGDYKIAVMVLTIAVIIAIVSYIIGGGLGLAFATAGKICKVGWFLVPIFPWDIFTGLVALFIAVMGFLFVPVLFVWINYHQVCKDYDAAEKYLKYCKTPSETE